MKPTEKQIKQEVARLKKLRPYGEFKGLTAIRIKLQIEALEHGFDTTADEWEEMSDSDKCAVNDALDWKDGFRVNYPPSTTWGGLAK